MLERKTYANIELERKILSYYIRVDQSIAVRLEYFAIDEARRLFSFVQKYPKLADSFDEWWSLWELELVKENQSLEPHKKFLQNIFIEDIDDSERIDFYLEKLRGFAEARQLYGIYEHSIGLYKDGEVTKAREVLENGLSNLKKDFSIQTISRSDFVEGFEERYELYQKKKNGEYVSKIPTGIRKVDKKIGGTARASLNFFQGESGVGKTFLLQEVAYQGMARKQKVLFVTIELQKIEIETRWDSRIASLDYTSLDKGEIAKKQEIWWRKRVNDLKKIYKEGGRLATSYIPEGCTIMSLEAELNYWEKKWEDKIEILVVDYGDLMGSGRKVFSEQEALGNIFKDLKRLSQTRDLVIWTATQTSGRSYGKSRIDLSDVGYSKKKAHWANLIIGIGGSEEEREEGILRLYVAKNSFGKDHIEVILYPDFSVGKVDIDE